MIGRNGEIGSGISMLAGRHDDDDVCEQKLFTHGKMSCIKSLK